MTQKQKPTPALPPTRTARADPFKPLPRAGFDHAGERTPQHVTEGEGVTRANRTAHTAHTHTPRAPEAVAVAVPVVSGASAVPVSAALAAASAPGPAAVPATIATIAAPVASSSSASDPVAPPLLTPLTPNQARVLLAILESDHTVTNADIATRTGMSERQIYRYWNQPNFVAKYKEVINVKIARSANRRIEALEVIATDPKNRNAVAASKLLFQLEGRLVNLHAHGMVDNADELLAQVMGCRVEDLPAPDLLTSDEIGEMEGGSG